MFVAASAEAQSQVYVSADGTELYDAPSPDAGILTTLPKGIALDVLEVSASGYTRVHTPDNWEGWVISQSLSDAESTTEVSQANPAIPPHSDVPEMSGTTPISPRPVAEQPVSATLAVIPVQHSITTDTDQIISANAAQQEMELMREKNMLLKDESNRHWFLTGAGVFLLGFIIGLIVPRIRWRRKSWHSY